MPKGRGKMVNHKGKHRRFTNPEELEEQKKREENERKWREARGDASSGEESDKVEGTESEPEEESSEEEETKKKGVEGLIQVENPNRIQKKTKKLAAINEIVKETSTKPELSRREREELDKQRAQANYQRLHAEGKTEEARADLARLAIIKQQREEAAKRREEERKQKEAAKQTKTAQMQKALGKKTT